MRLPSKQVTAPLVRPVYGDIVLAPQSFDLKEECNSGLQYKGTPRHMCVYTGRGADKHASYVLKVGEASRDQLDALLALEWQLPCCVVRIAF